MKTIGKLHLFVAALTLALTTSAVKAQSRLNCGIEAGAVLSFPADHMKGSSVGWQAGVTGEYAVDGSWLVESGLRLKSKPTDGGIARIFGYWGGYEGEEYRIFPCNKCCRTLYDSICLVAIIYGVY